MMAQHPEEAAVITSTAGGVMLNMGNLTDVRKQSMLISAETAKEKGVQFMLDVCGAACLPTRRQYALSLISTAMPAVIKGNYSEMTALAREDYTSSGVDADKTLSLEAVSQTAKRYIRLRPNLNSLSSSAQKAKVLSLSSPNLSIGKSGSRNPNNPRKTRNAPHVIFFAFRPQEIQKAPRKPRKLRDLRLEKCIQAVPDRLADLR